MHLPKHLAASLGGLAIVLAATACAGVATEDTLTTGAARPAQAIATTPTAPQSAVSAQPVASESAAAIPAGATRLSLIAGQSAASYVVGEQLAGRDLPNDAAGTTSGVTGSVTIGADGAILPGSKITVDLSTLESDESRRDNFVKSSLLQTTRYPTAELVPTAVEGLDQPLPTSGQVDFTLTGDLTVHGVTRPVTWEVVAEVDGDQVAGTALTTVAFADFGLTPPRIGPVLSVDDQLDLQLDFHAERTTA